MKTYNIYCDESSVNNKDLDFMWIWAIQVEREYRNIAIKKIEDLKKKHNYNLEIKWRKVSPKTKSFYLDLANLFFSLNIQFFSIIIDKSKIKLSTYHNSDEELAFYKYYYFLLKNRFKNESRYYLFLDQRIKKDKDRIKKMADFFWIEKQIRDNPFEIKKIWEFDSSNHLLIQLADFFIWAVCYDNNELSNSETKKEILSLLSKKIWKANLKFASKLYDEKFNIFKIRLD